MKKNTILLLAIAGMISACGGGGSGSSGSGTVTPPPVIVVSSSSSSSAQSSSSSSSSVSSSISSSSSAVITPIPVQKSSYLNFKNIGLERQVMPFVNNTSKFESITAGVAFGDFFQDGTIAMVAGSNDFTETVLPNGERFYGTAGQTYFFHTDGKGGWIDQTSRIMSDQTGCISARKLIVADFNGDAKPDVFMSCSGIDIDPAPTGHEIGEHPRLLLSSATNMYTNTAMDFTCYCHGAAAAEMNEKGYADIVIADPKIFKQPVILRNNKGTFTLDKEHVPESSKAIEQGITFSKPIWSVELIDFKGNGKFDLVLMGSDIDEVGGMDTGWVSGVYTNDGNNTFSDALATKLPSSREFNNPIDITYYKGHVYLYAVTSDYSKGAIIDVDYATLTTNGQHVFKQTYNTLSWAIVVNDAVVELGALVDDLFVKL